MLSHLMNCPFSKTSILCWTYFFFFLFFLFFIIADKKKECVLDIRLSPKHTAHGVAQQPQPICRHAKAYLSTSVACSYSQDSHLASGRSRIQALAPASTQCAHFISPPSLRSLGEIDFSHLPHTCMDRFRVNNVIQQFWFCSNCTMLKP